MGFPPELPNGIGDEDLRTTHIVHNPPAASDDSDNDSMDQYDGYQQLPADEGNMEYGSIALQDDDDQGFNSVHTNTLEDEQSSSVEVTHGDPNMPPIESVDAEVEREVWQAPRPLELEIELDSNKTQQILSAMANFSLPNMSVPAWADGVPEEHWKEELLQRIRQRKPTPSEGVMDVDKQARQ